MSEFTGHRLSCKAAGVVATELQTIERQCGGITPEAVVEAARKKSSPLHEHFTWDDTEAAHQYRLVQAAWLIRTVRVTVLAESGPKETRAFVRVVNDATDAKGHYVNVRAALNDSDWRQQLLEQAHRELDAFATKYAVLSELAEVLAAIGRIPKPKKTKRAA